MGRCRTDGSDGGVSGTTSSFGRDLRSHRRSRRIFLLRGLAAAIRRLGLILLLATGANAVALGQSQNPIDFEEFSGPTFFTGIQPPLTVGLATFSGGQILDATNFLPANPTSVYGTAFFCPGCLPTLTIDFAEPVSDLSIFLMNGQTFVVTYFVEDDQGGMTQITLPANSNSGAGTVMLPSSGIRKATISGSAGAWDFFIDNISFVAERQEFTISFSAFIPADNVTGGPQFCINTDFMQPIVQLYFKGDNRDFSPTSDLFRVRELVTVIPSESTDPDGLKEGSIQRPVSQSRSYASDALADGKIDENDEDGIPLDCVLFHDAATAEPDDMVVAVNRLTANSIQIDLDGGPSNPLIPAIGRPFGSLDWDFTITIDTSTGTPDWTLTGRHDGFPAYEIYINDIEIYRYSPGPAPYTFMDHVRKLMGSLDVKLGNRSGTLP